MTTKAYEKMKKQIKEQIKIVDIADEFGFTVKKRDHKIAGIAEHTSVNIYTETNSFYRNSTGVGGDVFKFMEHMEEINIPYKEAFAMLAKRVDPSIEAKEKAAIKKEQKGVLTLADRQKRARALLEQVHFDSANKNVMAYLIQERKINANIVYDFINKENLKQVTDDKGYKSATFIGYDDLGMPACVTQRACSSASKFKHELSGCDYDFGWLYDPSVNPKQLAYGDKYDNTKPLLCFESEIEKMSCLTIMQLRGKDINDYAYLSTGSTNKYKTIIQVAKRIGYKDVKIGFNNDLHSKINSGQHFAQKAVEELQALDIKAESFYPPNEINDWNDLLKIMVAEKEKTSSIKSRLSTAQHMVENKPISKTKEKAINMER